MANLFADLLPSQQTTSAPPQSDDFFGDLLPKTNFSNVSGGASSAPSFSGVQGGSASAAQSSQPDSSGGLFDDLVNFPENFATGAKAIWEGGNYEGADPNQAVGMGEGFLRRAAADVAAFPGMALSATPVGMSEKALRYAAEKAGYKLPDWVTPAISGAEKAVEATGADTMQYAGPREEAVSNIAADVLTNLIPLGEAAKTENVARQTFEAAVAEGKPHWDATKDALDSIRSSMDQTPVEAPRETAPAPTEYEQAAQDAWTGAKQAPEAGAFDDLVPESTGRSLDASTSDSTVLEPATKPKAEETPPGASGEAPEASGALFDDLVPTANADVASAAKKPEIGEWQYDLDTNQNKRVYSSKDLDKAVEQSNAPREILKDYHDGTLTTGKLLEGLANDTSGRVEGYHSTLAKYLLAAGKRFGGLDVEIGRYNASDAVHAAEKSPSAMPQGYYHPFSNAIRLGTDAPNQHLMLHETVHALTNRATVRGARGLLDGQAQKAYDTLAGVFDGFKNHLQSTGEVFTKQNSKGQDVLNHYGFTNVDEYLAEFFSNPKFRDVLKNTKLDDITPKSAGGFGRSALAAVRNVYTATVKGIRGMLGLPEKAESALDASFAAAHQFVGNLTPEHLGDLRDLGLKPAEMAGETRVPKETIDAQARAALDKGANPEAVRKRVEALYTEHGHNGPAPTSTKNAVRDAERAAEGRDPILKAAAQSNPETVAKAQKTLADNPNRPKEIFSRILDKGVNNISVEDEAVLLEHKVDLRNQRDSASKILSDPKASEDAKADARVTWSEKEAEIAQIDQATEAGGREWGRFGQFRQQLMRNDYSLENLERRTRAVLERPLTPKESAVVKEHADRIQTEIDKQAATQAKLDAYEKSPYKQMTNDLVSQLREASNKGTFLDTLKKNADESREWFKKNLSRVSSGVDPAAFYHLARIGAYHIANGAVKFADWVGKMKADLGEHFGAVEESLPDVYKAAKAQHDFGKTGQKPRVRVTDPEEKYQTARGKAIKKETEKLYEKIKVGDYAKKTRIHRELNEANKQAAYDLYKAKNLFRRHQFELEMSKRSPLKKILGTVGEAQNFARAIMTSVDLSATLRQGGFVSLAHPVRATRALAASIKAARGEKYAHDLQYEIEHRPNFFKYKQAGLDLTLSSGHLLDKVEEQFMSRWIEHMPTVLGGGLVRGSERAFKGFLNKLRADSFDSMTASLSKDGKNPTHEEMKAIANYVNVATGRGKIGKTNIAAAGLSKVFFAPRLVASRFNLLAGQPLYGGTRATRSLVLNEYARYLTGVGVVASLGYMFHDPNDKQPFLETDPRSANFGKMKFGNTYVDLMSGLGQATTFTARELSGENKNQKGEIAPLRSGLKPLNLVRKKPDESAPKYGGLTGADVASNFARTKLAPIPGAAMDLVTGKNVIGQPITLGGEAANLIAPMSLQNIQSVMQEHGVPGGTALTLLDLLGMSVQQRTPYKKAPKEEPKK